MRISLTTVVFILLFVPLLNGQVNFIGNYSGETNSYLKPSEAALFTIHVEKSRFSKNEDQVLNTWEVFMVLEDLRSYAGGVQETSAIEIKCSSVGFEDGREIYAGFLPENSQKNGIYTVDFKVLDPMSGVTSFLSDFSDESPTITIGEAGVFAAGMHFMANDELSFDFALLQHQNTLPFFPDQIGGIYTNGFCKDELVVFDKFELSCWKDKSIQNLEVNLYCRGNQDEYKRYDLELKAKAESGENLGSYFPGMTMISSPELEEYLFSLELLSIDLLNEFEFNSGENEISFFIEVISDNQIIRIPEEGEFQSMLKVANALVGAECQAALLPIDLLDFLVIGQETQVYLKWTSAIEINNQFYNIERSRDIINWKTIYEIHGQGNSTEYVTYTHIDKYPLSGLNYYRLRQMDYDGSLSYSKVRTVRIQDSSINLYPNPVKNQLYYQIDDPDQEYYIKIYNTLGDCVYQATIPDPAAQVHAIDLSAIPNGNYIIKYINANNYLSRTAKFIKI